MLVLIKLLLKPLVVVLLIGLICHFFYSLGRRRVSGNKGRASRPGRRPRKFVQCKVVENEEPPENDAAQKN